jgi:cytochrome c oxidase assembly protein subunit 11
MSENLSHANRRTTKKLVVIVAGMFAFGVFVLPPMYDLVCDITGLNGKTGRVEVEQALTAHPDKKRTITVEFDANLNANLAWDFKPMVRKVEVHPGEIGTATYHARNKSGRMIVAQAVPSVSPSRAAKYFNKTECFCFTQQTFGPGEDRDMPLRFIVDPDLPKDIKTITLSYTFFDTGKAPEVDNAAQTDIHTDKLAANSAQ